MKTLTFNEMENVNGGGEADWVALGCIGVPIVLSFFGPIGGLLGFAVRGACILTTAMYAGYNITH